MTLSRNLKKKLASKKIAARRLQTSHAFHSPMMEPVLAPFTDVASQGKIWRTGDSLCFERDGAVDHRGGSDKNPEYWAGHVRQTVRFADGVAELMKDSKIALLEVGPGQTLTTLARQHPAKAAEQTVLASLASTGDQEPHSLIDALGRLWMAGVAVDWPQFYADEHQKAVVLPTYPFERKRFWPDSTPFPSRGVSGRADCRLRDVERYRVHKRKASTRNIFHKLLESLITPAPVGPSAARNSAQRTAVKCLARADGRTFGLRSCPSGSRASLLELGLDSLLLTQAAQVFHRKFGVSISFRQLMEELGSLAGHCGVSGYQVGSGGICSSGAGKAAELSPSPQGIAPFSLPRPQAVQLCPGTNSAAATATDAASSAADGPGTCTRYCAAVSQRREQTSR